MLNKKLIIIYGAPRTGTSHMFRALIRHPDCFGLDAKLSGDGNVENKEFTTNEPYDICLDDPSNTSGIDRRWESLYEEGKKYMVLKAPGYCMAWDYFSKLESYECKYIFTDRKAMEVVDSLSNHKVAINLTDSEAVKGAGCPDPLLPKFQPLWEKTADQSDLVRKTSRFYYRYLWHVESIPKEMGDISLKLVPYESRLYANMVAISLISFLGILSEGGDWFDYLRTFYHRKISFERDMYLRSLLIR